MLVYEISTKVVKRWAIILTVETVGFLAHMGYNTEEEKVIPPTKANTIDAKIPKIEIYSFSIPLISL